MNKKDSKVNFDLSALSLKELIKTYNDINEFLKYLDSKTIKDDKAGNKNG